jgi:GTP cyclohydrolase I
MDDIKALLEDAIKLRDQDTNVQIQIECAVRSILNAIGEDPQREGLKDTPKRVANMFKEIYGGVRKTNEQLCQELLTVFTEEDTEGTDKFGDMVIVKDIPFYSTCEHHLVPFFGKAHVAYIPRDKIIGISKIARLVDQIAKRPQVQERISRDVLDCIVKMLQPKGVMVTIEAEHLCMSMRGIKKPGTKTVTSATYGAFATDPATRNEFLNLIKS